MITSSYSPGLGSRIVLPITEQPRHSRGTSNRMPLAAASGGTWLPLEGLSFLPTPLRVRISFWDDLGTCPIVGKLLIKYLFGLKNP